ncbi:MAG: hypothetical protein ACRC2O_13615, partial [Chitinophagaceae bacterium]
LFAVVPFVVPLINIDAKGSIVLLSVKILPEILVSCAWVIKHWQVKIKQSKKLCKWWPEYFIISVWIFSK